MRRYRLLYVPILVLMLALTSTSATASEESPPNDYVHPDVAPCAVLNWTAPESLDTAVQTGIETRTWFVGGRVTSEPVLEPYFEYGYKWRAVRYWDKGRWECTPGGSMTWGHLTKELMTGQVQIGHSEFEENDPSEVHVAGDPGAEVGPTYRTMGELIDEPAREVGDVISDVAQRDASVSKIGDFASFDVTASYYVPETDHTVADVFWDFMTGSYTVYSGRGAGFETRDFYPRSIELIGYPITEAYWTSVPVAGDEMDVLVQCFERRCLTYTPENLDGWQVEMGNIGQHYYLWRYPEGHE